MARPAMSDVVSPAGFAGRSFISIGGAAFRVHFDMHQWLSPALTLGEDADAIVVGAVAVFLE